MLKPFRARFTPSRRFSARETARARVRLRSSRRFWGSGLGARALASPRALKGRLGRRSRPEGRHVPKPFRAGFTPSRRFSARETTRATAFELRFLSELSCLDVEAPVRAHTARLPPVPSGRPSEDHNRRPTAAIRAAQSDRGLRLESLLPSTPALTVERRMPRGSGATCAHGRATCQARWSELGGARIPLEGM